MQLVNVHYFYAFSKTLQQLANVPANTTIMENFSTFYSAENALRDFMANDLLPPQASREKCGQLADLLRTYSESAFSEPPRTEPLNEYDIAAIANAMKEFEAVLEGEYRIKTVFAVSKKALYSLEQLVFRGDEMVTESVHNLMPGMKNDLKDAGRCIAFEVPTAAAFHLFRAAEAGVKSYILAVRGTPVTDKEKNLGLGGYKNILEEHGVDQRVLAALDQLIKLHRNPTIHPDVRVSNEEILATLGMVDSLIRIIAIDMERREKTPEKSLDEFLPTIAETQANIGVRAETEEATKAE